MVKPVFQFVGKILKQHKLKVLVLMLSPFLFFHLMFDYGSLSGYVSEKVNAVISGQPGSGGLQRQPLQISFDDLNLHFFPFVGVGLAQLDILAPHLARKPMRCAELIVGPDWGSLLSFREGFKLAAEELFGGDVRLSWRGLKGKTPQELRKAISLNFTTLNLGNLASFFQLPVQLRGTLDGSLEGEADLSFTQQPTAEFTLHIEKFKLPKDLLLSGFLIPSLDLKEVSIKGTLKDGLLTLTEFKVGQGDDELMGQISGDIDLKFPLAPAAMLATVPMRYRVTIDLSFKKSLESKLSLLLSFISAYKSQQGERTRYAFKISGQRLLDPSAKMERL